MQSVESVLENRVGLVNLKIALRRSVPEIFTVVQKKNFKGPNNFKNTLTISLVLPDPNINCQSQVILSTFFLLVGTLSLLFLFVQTVASIST